MKKDFILAIFNDEEDLIKGAEKARNKNVDIYDFYTPFPVHGLDELLGIKRSILPYVTFVAGATGLACALALQIWTSAIDWPINVGGKPFNSIPAFIPVSFELTVLFAAHTTVLAFLVINKLYPGRKPVIFHPDQTDHKFVMAVEKDQADFEELATLLKSNGAESVELKNIDLQQ
jgi:hypothetical protein